MNWFNSTMDSSTIRNEMNAIHLLPNLGVLELCPVKVAQVKNQVDLVYYARLTGL
jgi:hypothetical protein